MSEKTARTWDSFKETLHLVMKEFKPSLIFEWGPGASSRIMLEYKCVKQLDSFEHDLKYFEEAKKIEDKRFEVMHEENKDDYVKAIHKTYDFMFVDGRLREACILTAYKRIKPGGIVMVHDAERGRYKPAMLQFAYVIMTDCGSTATLTNDFIVYRKLLELLTGY